MFRKMRRQKQELSKKECMDILFNQPRGFLAVLGDNEYPYVIPMSHVYVNGKIYFHGAKQGHKNDAVKNNPKVSYCVMDDGVKNKNEWWYTFKSVVVFGKIKTLADDSEKIDKLTYLGNKFFSTTEETKREINRLLNKTEVFELTIDHMAGKLVIEK